MCPAGGLEESIVPYADRASYPVLVIDDVSAARRVIKRLLNNIGFSKIYEASNGSEALQLIDEEPLRLVIADLNLGDMKGTQIFETLLKREEMKDIPFMLISSDLDATELHNARAVGLSSCLLKPVTLDMLEDELSELLKAKGHFQSPLLEDTEESIKEHSLPASLEKALEQRLPSCQGEDVDAGGGATKVELNQDKLEEIRNRLAQATKASATALENGNSQVATVEEGGLLGELPLTVILDCLVAAVVSSVGTAKANDVYDYLSSSGREVSLQDIKKVLNFYKIA